jgi:hypothetical protein
MARYMNKIILDHLAFEKMCPLPQQIPLAEISKADTRGPSTPDADAGPDKQDGGIWNVRNVSGLRKMTRCTCKMCPACLLNVTAHANADL